MEQEIKAPFTKEQVEKLNAYQQLGKMHPFTCANDGDEAHIKHEFEKKHKGEDYQGFIAKQKAAGINFPEMEFNQTNLIATENGWICPVCDYKQNWAHPFMANPKKVEPNRNEMVAEFMGLKYDDHDEKWHDGKYFQSDLLKYETSWDWLMPVIEKIEGMGYSVDMSSDMRAMVADKYYCGILERGTINKVTQKYSKVSRINAAWLAVVEFIEKYYLRENTCTEDRHIHGCRCGGDSQPYHRLVNRH